MFKRFFWLLALFVAPAMAAESSGSDSGVLSSLVKLVKDFANKLWEKITGFSDWILKIIKGLLEAAWDMAKDAFSWVFEQVLDLVSGIIGALYTESGADDLVGQVASAWAGVPAEVSQVASSLGLGTAMTMIAAAIFIRVLLQLVPFTRLGS